MIDDPQGRDVLANPASAAPSLRVELARVVVGDFVTRSIAKRPSDVASVGRSGGKPVGARATPEMTNLADEGQNFFNLAFAR